MSLGLPIQVRLQTQSDVQPLQFRGPLDCFRQTFRNEGFLGFFRVSILTL
jgi:mitochondrial ornithine carrier protein